MNTHFLDVNPVEILLLPLFESPSDMDLGRSLTFPFPASLGQRGRIHGPLSTKSPNIGSSAGLDTGCILLQPSIRAIMMREYSVFSLHYLIRMVYGNTSISDPDKGYDFSA